MLHSHCRLRWSITAIGYFTDAAPLQHSRYFQSIIQSLSITSNCFIKSIISSGILRKHQGVSFHRHDTFIRKTVSIDLSHTFLIYSMDHSWVRWDIATVDLTDILTKNVTSKDKEKLSWNITLMLSTKP